MNDFDLMLADQGKVVEAAFYRMFPGLQFIQSKGVGAVKETQALEQQGVTHMAQAAFTNDDFFAQSDLVIFNGNKHIEIYEIKSSSSMQNMGADDTLQAPSKEEHIRDLTFQYETATQAGYIVNRLFLVELNKLYTRSGEIDLNSLFDIKEVTREVLDVLPGLRNQMSGALDASKSMVEPTTCDCRFLPRKKQCPAFGYMHPDLTGYNVYDLAISRSPKRLKELIDASIFRIEDIPAGTKMTDSYRDQVITWKENREIILVNEIRKILDQLEYPLYFLDYETTGPAIPKFDNTRPYQQIPFQYSLHRIVAKGGDVGHIEYLHRDHTPPMHAIVKHLRNDIGDTGTIIVWNKTFEKKCNENLSECVPAMKDFLLNINSRLFDLMEIFSKHLYVHKDFRGSHSIKKVLPVLVPELSYDSLTIRDGGTATTQWDRMVFEIEVEKEKEIICQNLLVYCKLDTLAMVEVYRKLLEKIRN